jgi:ElaB/YqjD/DUF883 family membrane-anchored ribosome-binding protein
MANSDMKSSAQSAIRDTKNTLRDASSGESSSSLTSSVTSSISEKFGSLKETAGKFASDASPRVRDAVGQVSDVASDLYSRANTWIGEDTNRKYGIAAMVATVGVLAFFLGRSFSSSSKYES